MRTGDQTIGSRTEQELVPWLAADRLGVSRQAVLRLMREGVLPSRRDLGVSWIRVADIDKFIQERNDTQQAAFNNLRELEHSLDRNGLS